MVDDHGERQAQGVGSSWFQLIAAIAAIIVVACIVGAAAIASGSLLAGILLAVLVNGPRP